MLVFDLLACHAPGLRAKTEGVVNGNKLANNINMLQSCEVEDEDEEDAGDE